MSKLAKVGSLLLLCTCLSLQACSPPAESASAPPPSEAPPLQSPEYMALQGFARSSIARKTGLDVDYAWESVDRKSGSSYACGHFNNKFGKGSGYYLAKPGDVQISWDTKYPESWKIYCAAH